MKTHVQALKSAILTIATLSISVGSARAAVLIADFSAGTGPVQGWGVTSLGAGVPIVAGAGQWGSATASQYWGKLTIPNWATGDLTIANVNSGDRVDFDLILPSLGWQSGHVNIELSFTTDGPVDRSAGWQTYDISALKDQVVHFSIDYSMLGGLPASSGLDMHLNINPGYDWMWDGSNPGAVAYTDQQFYIDNIMLTNVPEPTVTVLGVAGAMLVLRRRR